MIPKSSVCVLLPTCHRPDGLRRALTSLRATAPECSCVVAVDPNDWDATAIVAAFGYGLAPTPANYCGCHVAWNCALRAAPPDALAFVLGADDDEFMPGWLDAALAALDTIGGSGVVGLEDDKVPGRAAKDRPFFWASHFLMTRDFLVQHNGGVMAFEHYYANCTDKETCMRAMRVKKYVFAADAHITHHWRGAKQDADMTYKKSRPHYSASEAEYRRREALGFPDDFPPILTA